MIKPYIMTSDQIKTYSGISDTTYDTSIDIFLPVVSDDLTRINGICNQNFLYEGTADTDGTVTLSNVDITGRQWDTLYIGAVVLIGSEDGVIASFDEDNTEITLKTALTATGTEEDFYIRNFPTGAKAIVSAMVMYKISESSPDGGTMLQEIASLSSGPLSVSFRETGSSGGFSSYDSFGYPASLTRSLATVKRKRFI